MKTRKRERAPVWTVCRARREEGKRERQRGERERERGMWCGELAYGNGARDSIITETRLIKDAQLKSSVVRSLGSFVRSFLVAQTSASPHRRVLSKIALVILSPLRETRKFARADNYHATRNCTPNNRDCASPSLR